jgi:hypothetical protein
MAVFIDTHVWLIDCMWVRGLTVQMQLALIETGPLCPISNHGSPVALLKFQMVPMLILLISPGSGRKEPRHICLSEAKTSHSQRMWAEVSCFTPHPLHNGLSSSPSKWRCLLRVLCPVSRPVTTLDWVLNLTLAPRLGPEINSLACLWVTQMLLRTPSAFWSIRYADGCTVVFRWLAFYCRSRG